LQASHLKESSLMKKSFLTLSFAVISIVFAAAPARAVVVVGGSSLLSPVGAAQLETWLDATPLYSGSLQLTNIFTKTAGSTGLDFHAAVDGQGPTILVMSATTIRGGRTDLIGGFNPLSWSSSGFYQNTPPGDPRNAFIFDLSTLDLRPQSNVQIGVVQTRNLGFAGPIFGAGNDIAVGPLLTLGSVNPESYGVGCNSHMGFSCEGQPNFFGGINETLFLTGGLEVFTISEIAAIPEMSTWAMMMLGFAGLGITAYRRTNMTALAI
jgi:hypothetical protein